jgi:cysteine desulfurase/selenocysteine lyase
MSFDIAMMRAHTPASQQLIHFNNAGASLTPNSVHRAVIRHLQLEQKIGGYEAAKRSHSELENFYVAFSKLLNCEQSEIAWADSATHGWNALVQAIPFTDGDKILTGQNEYASNFLTFLHLHKTRGIQVEIIPNDASGAICLDRLEAAIDKTVKLISLTHVASHNGRIQPAEQVGTIARKHGVLYILDACQSAGQLVLDVETLGCDMLTGTGRKYLRGPRGTGFLYIRKEKMDLLTPATIDLHSARWTTSNTYTLREDARRFESFEHFVAGKIGLAAAVDYALEIGLDTIQNQVIQLAQRLRDSLLAIDGITVHDQGQPLSGIVSFSSRFEDAQSLQLRLQKNATNSSVIYAASTRLESEHLGLGDRNRASIHYYNTDQEIDRFCANIQNRGA